MFSREVNNQSDLQKHIFVPNLFSLGAPWDDDHRVHLMKVVNRGGGGVMRRGRANNEEADK